MLRINLLLLASVIGQRFAVSKEKNMLLAFGEDLGKARLQFMNQNHLASGCHQSCRFAKGWAAKSLW